MDSGILSTQSEKLPASGLTLELNRIPSFIMGIYIVFFLLIFIVCYLLTIQFWLFSGVAFVIALYGQFLFRKKLLRNHPDAIKKIVFTELSWCFMLLNNSQIIKADIEPDSILTEHLIILNLNGHSQRNSLSNFFNHYSVLLTASEVGGEKFRQLKRHLRLINFSKKEEV